MNWEESVIEAKEELGYHPDEYINDWDEVVELAHMIFDEEYEGFCDEATEEHKSYLVSAEWIMKRNQVLKRDNFCCVDCRKKATQVHHISYDSLHTSEEINNCVGLCRVCHKARHGSVKKKEADKDKCVFCGDRFKFYHDCTKTGKFISIDEHPEYHKLNEQLNFEELTKMVSTKDVPCIRVKKKQEEAQASPSYS